MTRIFISNMAIKKAERKNICNFAGVFSEKFSYTFVFDNLGEKRLDLGLLVWTGPD